MMHEHCDIIIENIRTKTLSKHVHTIKKNILRGFKNTMQ